MPDPQMPPPSAKGLRLALRFMLFIGLLALAYVILQSFSVPKNNLNRFAEGSLRKLTVMDKPPAQPGRSFNDANGESVSLSDFGGKYVLLNLWATWCAPCVAEIPSLDLLQEARGGKSFEVVAVSMDRHRVEAESFLKSKGITHLALYHDASLGLGDDVKVIGLPISVIYNPAGREIARIPGEVNWQSAEAEAFIRAVLAGGSGKFIQN